ncbi:oligosaccharide biosynthesis protein Alg14 [Flaviaesturariibacter flavus]|uniref:Oligosaccharide biosynthesis protein Alg14 n=1 Tax=Flaviaesturariibacter flavus TaxID=2502780 RepID=A0A4R1BJ78_9BACT|nr:oligosaccharide biosynthesis protein Alg14 [Flaviaesturariibacter flavus]TCJ17405.1 oligosaccharide biosynthesis protein Alg14 [Flaviaesturariibacter flavus]
MKILAVASGGGHVVELLRLRPAFDGHELVYMSTHESFATSFKGHEYVTVPDLSRWNAFRIPYVILRMRRAIARIRPDVVVTTGAGPGVLALFLGWLMGARTIWVEASCHTEQVSISGKICALFADRVYTQWSHLATSKIVYSGNVMK